MAFVLLSAALALWFMALACVALLTSCSYAVCPQQYCVRCQSETYRCFGVIRSERCIWQSGPWHSTHSVTATVWCLRHNSGMAPVVSVRLNSKVPCRRHDVTTDQCQQQQGSVFRPTLRVSLQSSWSMKSGTTCMLMTAAQHQQNGTNLVWLEADKVSKSDLMLQLYSSTLNPVEVVRDFGVFLETEL